MTELVAILNLTPDSFSGDGKYGRDVKALLAEIDQLIEAGAAVIDVGAESTRPGALTLSADEEWQRIAPLSQVLADRVSSTVFSLDTYHPQNAARALDAGFGWINDVSGGSADMLRIVKPYKDAVLVLMHSLAVPANKSITLPESCDPVQEVLAWGNRKLQEAVKAGIAQDRIILDPGIGFGKTAGQSMELIRRCAELLDWEIPVLIGHSRKSFLRTVAGDDMFDRDTATLSLSAYLALQGMDYLRVHDVRSHRLMLDTLGALA